MFVLQSLARLGGFLLVVSSGEENERKALEGFLYPYLSEPKRYESNFLLVYGDNLPY